ncbi:hypothetical protein GCM10007304_33110 [Rhodococcoides trifolii]|uniref:Uncharacterized protein n=1 Tax=Rhodococcoides trifolii TaxID=908250 RepID=A0A917LEU8_9NOCA|nr:hypothetical protein [Rhodococcus trifolii]GGG16350.1 hypothetical protein GCM10007304_33110 [Rhodococcus trifolii]
MKQPDEGNLFTDLMELGPAPTMSREIVVVVISLAIVAVLFAIVGPSVPALAATAAIVVFLAVRFAIGLRNWGKQS